MSSIEVQGVSRKFQTTTALEPIDLKIREGEFLTLLGPSGCGKTTTLRLIAGFLEPTTGRILFDGQDVSTLPPRLRSVGMVFQDYALFPHLTVFENIAFGLRERKYPSAQLPVRVKEMLDLVRLDEYATRYPSELSGGQKQRVALARAVAFPPRVLLMDEPLGALDLKLREAMQRELMRVQRQLRITTVYVTHDQTEAMNMSDRIVLMERGRIVQAGTAQELYENPVNMFAASFFGNINLLPFDRIEKVPQGEVMRLEAHRSAHGGGACSGVASTATLALRPEHITLRKTGGRADLENALPATVTAVRFYGNLLHVDVSLIGGLSAIVETRPGDPCAVVGECVDVCWSPEKGTVLID